MSKEQIYVVQSDHQQNTYFIFRDDGVEVAVKIRDGLMNPSHELTPAEANYFRKNILVPVKLRAS